MSKTALITGLTGQDGSYMAELLLEDGYEVHGLVRRSSIDKFDRLEENNILDKITIHEGDMGDPVSLSNLISEVRPHELYNFAAMSDVPFSFISPFYTEIVNSLSVMVMLEAIKQSCSECKFYQASSSEMYGNPQEIPQVETTPLKPISPYAISKTSAYHYVRYYREAFGLFAVNGILFNHESPRRGDKFVTKKIVKHAVEVLADKRECIYLGNLDAKRDWGYAVDYMEAIRLMMDYEKPDDWVISTGESHSVRSFCELVFKNLGYDLEWSGKGLSEVGSIDGKTVIRISEDFYRPSDIRILKGDASKAKYVLGWSPKTPIEGLVEKMVSHEIAHTKVNHD